MKKVALMLLISCNVVFSMELPQAPQRGQKRPASEIEQPVPKVPAAAQPTVALPAAAEQRTAFELLPDEIKNLILSFLTTARGATNRARLDNAAENIRSFFRINTQFAPLGNDPQIIEYLITELANRYANGDKLAAAIALGTDSVGKWLNALLNSQDAKIYLTKQDIFRTMQNHLNEAVANGRINVIKFLLQFQLAPAPSQLAPPPSYDWVRPLREAVKNNHLEAVRVILFSPVTQAIRNALVNSQDTDGTPLFDAVHNNNESMVDLLLDAGADVNRINWYEATSLAIAAENHNAPIIKKLLARGVEPNILNLINPDTGQTPLTTVISTTRDLDTIKALLDAGANVNQENEEGQTPLRVAEEVPAVIDQRVIELLKARGARR